MNIPIYVLKITNYNNSSEPEVERYVRKTKENLEYLKKECESYWNNDDDNFSWDEYNSKWWSYNNGDCCYAVISEEILYFNADKSTTMKSE